MELKIRNGTGATCWLDRFNPIGLMSPMYKRYQVYKQMSEGFLAAFRFAKLIVAETCWVTIFVSVSTLREAQTCQRAHGALVIWTLRSVHVPCQPTCCAVVPIVNQICCFRFSVLYVSTHVIIFLFIFTVHIYLHSIHVYIYSICCWLFVLYVLQYIAM